MPGWNPSSLVDGREVGSESSKLQGSPYKEARSATVTFFRGGPGQVRGAAHAQTS
jgi:hypothetical protein